MHPLDGASAEERLDMCIWRVRDDDGGDALVFAPNQRSARLAAMEPDDRRIEAGDGAGDPDTQLSLVLPDRCARDGDQVLVLMSRSGDGPWTLFPQLALATDGQPAVLADVTSLLALLNLLELPVDREGRIVDRGLVGAAPSLHHDGPRLAVWNGH